MNEPVRVVITGGTGVYVAMNGKVFLWNNVRKNRDKQVFENLQKTVE